MHYLCVLPDVRRAGRIPELFSDDPAAMAAFVAKWCDKPGRSIYRCVATLKAGVRRRALDTVAALAFIHVDIDFRSVALSPDEVDETLRGLPLRPEIRDSGGGRHVLWPLKEPALADTPEFDRVNALRTRLTRALGGDPAPNHAAALLRELGTLNRRHGEPRTCHVLQTGEVADITEIEDLADLLDVRVLIPPRPKANGHDKHAASDHDFAPGSSPVEVEQRLAGMRFEGGGEAGIHWTQLQCTGSLLRSGCPVDDVVNAVLEATRKAVAKDARAAEWDWTAEERGIRRMCYDLINKSPELAPTLPDKLLEPFQQTIESGRKPRITFSSNIGWHVRANRDKAAAGSDRNDGATDKGPSGEAPKVRFKLTPLHELHLDLNEQSYLVDELIPAAGLVVIWGKAKAYKSFFTFDLMLHVAMGWTYRDRIVQQGAVIYCAFEGAHGYRGRKAAAFKHYGIEGPVPLHIMAGSVNLIKDHGAIVRDIKLQLGDVIPRAVVLDTLNKSLHGSESSDEDMGNYIRAAEAIRDAFGCVVVIVHHCGYDDSHPRGHTGLPGAVDAQLRVTKGDNSAFTAVVEMMRDGPEEVEIVSRVQVVDLGQGPNGKPRTSLVVVPCEEPTAGGHRKWPKGLTIFLDALREARRKHGEPFQVELGQLPETAVDLEKLRPCFYRLYPSDGESDRKKQDAKRQAFNRDLRAARSNRLIGTATTETGRTLVWFTP